jgi:hypothetical protein
VAVDAREEQRDADAGILVDHGLHVGIHLLALGGVERGTRLERQRLDLAERAYALGRERGVGRLRRLGREQSVAIFSLFY